MGRYLICLLLLTQVIWGIGEKEGRRIVVDVQVPQYRKILNRLIRNGVQEIATEKKFVIIDDDTKKKAYKRILKDRKWSQNDPAFLVETGKQMAADLLITVVVSEETRSGVLFLTLRLADLKTGTVISTRNIPYDPRVQNYKIYGQMQVAARKLFQEEQIDPKSVYLEVKSDFTVPKDLEKGVQNTLTRFNMELVGRLGIRKAGHLLEVEVTPTGNYREYRASIKYIDNTTGKVSYTETLYYKGSLKDPHKLYRFGTEIIEILLGKRTKRTGTSELYYLILSPIVRWIYLDFYDVEYQNFMVGGIKLTGLQWRYRNFFVEGLGGSIEVGPYNYKIFSGDIAAGGLSFYDFRLLAGLQFSFAERDRDTVVENGTVLKAQFETYGYLQFGYFFELFDRSGLNFFIRGSYGRRDHAKVSKQSGLQLSSGITFDWVIFGEK